MIICRSDWYCLGTNWHLPGSYLRWWQRHSDRSPSFPQELRDLVGVPQDPVWHPEGDAFQHTTYVVDAMAALCDRNNIQGDRRVMFFLAAVCHDLGKATTTIFHAAKGRWVAPGHDVAGVPIAEKFLKSIETSPEIVAQVLPLVRHHMVHCRQGFTTKAVRKLARSLHPMTIRDLLLLMEADCNGRPPLPPGLPPVVLNELIPLADSLGLMDSSGV